MLLSSERRLQLLMLGVIGFPFIGVIIAMVLLWQRYFFVSDIILFLVFYTLSTIGITVGYHRMLTHKSFEAPNWVRALLLIFGTMTLQGPADIWAATHVKHHAHSDEEDDPHSPIDGLWHAHMGWLFYEKYYKDNRKEFAPHLLKDPVVQFVSRTFIFWSAVGLIIPFLLGGWTGFIWGGLVRVFCMNHVTYSVNSICHTFGKRDYETTDQSRNNWLIGLLAFGEGWHNNHHAFPTNAFHGMRWWQIDFSGIFIRSLEKVGLAWNIQRVSREAEDAHKKRSQSMIDSLLQMKNQVMDSIADLEKEIEILSGKLSDTEILNWQKLQTSAQKRLKDIKRRLLQNDCIKKPKLKAYQAEVTDLANSIRQKWKLKYS